MARAPRSPRARLLPGILLLLLTALLLAPGGACGVPGRPAPIRLVVLAYNVKHGLGMDGQLDLDRAAAVIRAHDPDVVALQEIDRGCGRSGGVDQAARLAERCGMHAEFGAFMDYDGGQYGMAVLSRLPIVAVRNHRLPAGAEPRSALEVRVRLGAAGPTVVLTGVHLYRTEAERLAQAETLLALYEDEMLPVILVGDFNSQRGDAVMARLEQDFANPDKQGPPATFPADEPDREIDFALLRPADRLPVRRHFVVDERVASDHRPVLLEVEVGPPPLR